MKIGEKLNLKWKIVTLSKKNSKKKITVYSFTNTLLLIPGSTIVRPQLIFSIFIECSFRNKTLHTDNFIDIDMSLTEMVRDVQTYMDSEWRMTIAQMRDGNRFLGVQTSGIITFHCVKMHMLRCMMEVTRKGTVERLGEI